MTVRAKWVEVNPSLLGTLFAAITIATLFSVWEEKTIRCGECKHRFIKTLRDKRYHTKCPVCKTKNYWEREDET